MMTIQTTPTTEVLLDALKFGFKSFDTYKASNDFDAFAISAVDTKRLMRAFRKTIRELSRESTITQKRIREWRRDGLRGFYAVEAIFYITGVSIR